MSTGQTVRSMRRWKRMRPDIDREAKRYFVYRLNGADGSPVYIGRSCNVAARLRAHYGNATHPVEATAKKAAWLFDARSVSMTGPYTWDQAVREERRQIEAHEPPGNVALTRRAKRRY